MLCTWEWEKIFLSIDKGNTEKSQIPLNNMNPRNTKKKKKSEKNYKSNKRKPKLE